MPYRRRTTRRSRYSRKRTGKKAFKRVMRKMRKSQLAVFKLRQTTTLSSTAAGNIQYRFTTADPSAFVSINGAGYATALEDWSGITSLYDQYRVCAVKLKFIPNYPNNTTATTAYAPVYCMIDYDTEAPPGTVADVIQYNNLKVKNLYRPWKLYYKIPKSTPSVANAPQASVGYGWVDVAKPVQIGAIQLLVNGASISSSYGTIIATYYICAKNRR